MNSYEARCQKLLYLRSNVWILQVAETKRNKWNYLMIMTFWITVCTLKVQNFKSILTANTNQVSRRLMMLRLMKRQPIAQVGPSNYISRHVFRKCSVTLSELLIALLKNKNANKISLTAAFIILHLLLASFIYIQNKLMSVCNFCTTLYTTVHVLI